ncbi:MAG: succinylglutamate desuccinylase/aspartoacylase family protein [Oligoflexia bacterium]|nr:succinylglutamate desuccinylase/aspartoacylase family protein [Oligoflexia bacterium]
MEFIKIYPSFSYAISNSTTTAGIISSASIAENTVDTEKYQENTISLSAYKSNLFKENSSLYLIAGINGNEVEGIYVLDQLYKWMQAEQLLELPIIVIPILNIEGYYAGIKENSQGLLLDSSFPIHWNHPQAPTRITEVEFIQELFESYPPLIVFTFRTASFPSPVSLGSQSAKIISSKGSREFAEFFIKYNEYSLSDWKENEHRKSLGEASVGSFGGTLEGYAANFFSADILSFHLPKMNRNLSLKEIWSKNETAFKNFLIGQRFGR